MTAAAITIVLAAIGVRLRFIQPGKPDPERVRGGFFSRLRAERLNQHWLGSLGGDASHRGLAAARRS